MKKDALKIVPHRLHKIMFGLSIVGLVFILGVVAGEYRYFPHDLLSSGFRTLSDLEKNWQSYARIRPTKFLIPSVGQGGVTIHDPDRAFSGLTFILGLFDGHPSIQLMKMDGTVVNRWTPDFDQVWADLVADPALIELVPANEWDNEIQGVAVLPNGDAVMNYGNVLLKLDRCNNILWKHLYGTHHSVDFAEDGGFWVSGERFHQLTSPAFPAIAPPWTEDLAIQVSSDGEVINTISLPDLLIKNGMYGALFPKGMIGNPNPGFSYDLTHLNDIEELSTAMADKFPMFEAGDLLVSLRNVNLVFVFNPDSLVVKWSQTGPWVRQHDPDFLPDGRISVFNNHSDGTHQSRYWDGSNIMVVDPPTHITSVAVPEDAGFLFYSHEAGAHQWLDNGNILITETVGGRVLEVAPNNSIVWEFVSRYDSSSVMRVLEATRLPSDYFNVESWTCDQGPNS